MARSESQSSLLIYLIYPILAMVVGGLILAYLVSKIIASPQPTAPPVVHHHYYYGEYSRPLPPIYRV